MLPFSLVHLRISIVTKVRSEFYDVVGEPVGSDGEGGSGGRGREELTSHFGTAVALHRDTGQGLAEKDVVTGIEDRDGDIDRLLIRREEEIGVEGGRSPKT